MSLKYPVLLVHGMGFRDDNKLFSYWGRIPNAIEARGCQVFMGNQDCNAAIETNGEYLVKRVNEILEETGAKKINIIAHSKGGLDSRYAISTLGLGNKVASLTTLATPHNGSKTVDKILKLPDFFARFAGLCADSWCRAMGDQQPHSYRVFHSFRTDTAAKFNQDNPDCEGVIYQSYAFVMKKPLSDFWLWFPNMVVRHIEGKNDGLLPPEAVKWGDFKGTYSGVGRRGISHLDEIDFRRKPLSKQDGDGIKDIIDLYGKIVTELSEMGL